MPRALMAATAGLALAGSAAAGLFAGRALIERPVTAIKQLTFRRGAVTGARFAADERTVVYSASWEGKPNEIFMTRLDGPETRSLGLPPAKLLSVSSRGELAILLTQPGELGDPSLGTLARVALVGGVPRSVLEDVEEADWSPDGGELAIVRKVNGERQLEYPAGNVLWKPIRADPNNHGLRVSPRGDRVALQTDAAITIVDRSGRRQAMALPANTWVGGLAWAPEGDAFWVTAGPMILRLGLDGSRREIFHAPGPYVLHDVSRSGAALLHHGFERNGVRVKQRGEATEREVPLQALGGGAVDLSRDGSQVLIYDLSNRGHYLYPVRGGEPVLLARNLGWPKLSPDGRWLLTGPGAGKAAKLMPIGPGEPRDLPLGDPEAYPLSFVDSGRVYWAAQEAGQPARRGFVQDVATGALRSITPEGVEPLRSPVVEGAVLGRRPDGTLVWYPIDGGQPRPTAARVAPASLSIFSAPLSLQTTSEGRWTFVSLGGAPARIDRIDLVNGRREAWKTLAPPDLAGIVYIWPWVPMSADGQAYAYTYLRVFQDLYLVEGLR